MKVTRQTKRYHILDQITGWWEPDAAGRGLSLTSPDGYLTLDALPGRATPLLDQDRQQKEFECPSALGIDELDRVVVVDVATNQIKRIAGDAIETLRSIGGLGPEVRRFNEPRGVAVLTGGDIVVADTANHRVQIFSRSQYSTVQVWGATDGLGRPAPGTAPKAFRWPCAVVADPCGAIYISDRGNKRIQKISRDGTYIGQLGECFLNDPARLALGPNEEVAVVDQKLQAVVVFSPERYMPRLLPIPANPRSVAFDPDGRLYVGDAFGLVHVLARDRAAEGGYRLFGAGVSGVDGEVVDLIWAGSQGVLAIIAATYGGKRQRFLWRIAPAEAHAHEGSFITRALDGTTERCQWHRVLLDAMVPERTSLQVESFTSDQLEAATAGSSIWTTCVLSGDDNPDCLVQSGPGRYLWLRITFRSNGSASPLLRRLKAFFPRDGYLRYLPAVYQEDEESRLFLDRFLSIFQSEFDRFDEKIDSLWQLFDPDTVSDPQFTWLAAWVALFVPPDWSSEKKRQMLKQAITVYARRGTPDGIERAVEDYTGVTSAKILEHFRLRRWPALSVAAPLDGTVRLWSRDFYKRLQVTSYSQLGYFRLTGQPEPALEPFEWGAHQFTVFFPADPYDVDETKKQVARVVDREKPAYTSATLCPVLPRFRVGVQATVGVDSVVGGISHLVLGKLSTLGYDSILACSAQEHQLRAGGASPRPRAGVTTRLS
jgi:phage tail-like protein